jgi:hypothetical protein
MKVPDIPFQSPVIRYDALAQVEIFERRNTATGAVSFQTPSPEQIKSLEEGDGPAAATPGARISVLV